MKKIGGRSKAARAARFTGLRDCEVTFLDDLEIKLGGSGCGGSKPQEPKTTVLQEAHDLIYGQREQDYGDPKKNLNDIGDLWTAFIRAKYEVDLVLYPEDVCNMMVLLKMARGFNGSKKRDNSVDMAGYIGLIERIER